MALRHAAESPKQAQPGDILVVIHAFDARSPDELSLIKGERIKLVEKDDDFGDGWYLGEHLTDGRTGLFPEGSCLLPLRRKQGADINKSTPNSHHQLHLAPIRCVRTGPAALQTQVPTSHHNLRPWQRRAIEDHMQMSRGSTARPPTRLTLRFHSTTSQRRH